MSVSKKPPKPISSVSPPPNPPLAPAQEVHEMYEQQHAALKRRRRKQTLARVIGYPLSFIVVNGSLVIFAWLIGFLDVLKHHEPTTVFYIRIALFVMLYLGWIFAFSFLIMKTLDKLKMQWFFEDY